MAAHRVDQRRRRSQTSKKKKRWTRDGLTYALGIAGGINEAFIRTEEPRDALLIFFASCIGLPTVFHLNEMKNKPPEDEEDPP